MAVIIEYTDMLGVKHLGLQNMPFPDLVKYCVLGVSGLLLLLALGIFLWQIFRCCTQNNATQDTSDDYWESHTVASFLQGPSALNGGPGRRRTLNPPPTLKGGATRELGEPSEDKVSGSLRFSLFYEPLPSRLVVTILQAEGLQRRSQAHRPHPFVRLRLMWEEPENQEQKSSLMNEKGEGEQPALCSALQEWHTRVVRDSCSPLFGEQFSCALLRQHDLPRVTLRMEVKDFDGFSRHMVLGEVRVPLRHLDMSYPLELREPLQTPQKDPVGQVLLSLRFLPAAQRLEVGVLKIRTLQTDSDSALHARISVRCDQSKLRQQRTTAVHQGQVTVFNQVLMFSLLEFPPQECSIALSVYKTGGNRRHKHLVGQLTVAKQRRAEDLHWTLMMQSVRQPIAMWHQLLT